MLCEAVRALRLAARPWARELEGAEWRWLRVHLDECRSCQTWWQREELWDAQLQRAMTAVPVPGDLPQQIAARLSLARRLRWRRRALLSAALAASVLLAFTVGLVGHFGWFYRHLDLAALHGHIPIPEHPTAESISRLLEQYGIHIPAELQSRWDFRHLKAIYYSYEQGRWLCNLEFRREDSGAQVVVKLVPRSWCRAEQLESLKYQPGFHVLGVDESGPYVALVVGDPSHIASFYRPVAPAS
ncbi:hypothetical protein HRbin36_00214 [bacterium HR36]|nr:hypothetical protein HRbin36_00214 [bacterium HR36]